MTKKAYSPEKRREQTLKKFGLTPDEYEAQLRFQGGVCCICFEPPKGQRLHVEHDHATRRLRGLVHYNCNRLISRGGSPTIFRRIAEYLERPAWQIERYAPKKARRRRPTGGSGGDGKAR